MKIEMDMKMKWFDEFLFYIGFGTRNVLYIFIFTIIITLIFVGWRRIVVGIDDKKPSSPHAEIFLALGVFAISMAIARHIAGLLGQSTTPFDTVLAITLSFSALFGALLTTGSGVFSAALFVVMFLSSTLRFVGGGSSWANSIDQWLKSYFPYQVSGAELTTGLIVFMFSAVHSLYFVRTFNQGRREAVERGKNVGIDTEALEKLAYAVSIIAGMIFAMLATGVSLPTISLITGLLAAGIGFAGKDILSNIAAGIVLIWDGSFKVGDVISMDGGGYGWIDRLTLRHAIIKDRDDMSILIPYTRLINTTIQNWTHEDQTKVRLKIDIGIDYGTESLEVARTALIRAAMKPQRVLKDPSPRVNVMAAGESAIQLQVRFWISDPKSGIRNVMSEVLEGMIAELKAEKINIPFNTIDVNLKRART